MYEARARIAVGRDATRSQSASGSRRGRRLRRTTRRPTCATSSRPGASRSGARLGRVLQLRARSLCRERSSGVDDEGNALVRRPGDAPRARRAAGAQRRLPRRRYVLLWALRGWGTWREWARFAGLAYLLGVAGLGIVWTLHARRRHPSAVRAPALSGGALALRRRRRSSAGHEDDGWPSASPPLVLTTLSLVSAVGIAAVGVFFEALFRAGRLHGLYAFDAWAFWIPKAKAIYAAGRARHRLPRPARRTRPIRRSSRSSTSLHSTRWAASTS